MIWIQFVKITRPVAAIKSLSFALFPDKPTFTSIVLLIEFQSSPGALKFTEQGSTL